MKQTIQRIGVMSWLACVALLFIPISAAAQSVALKSGESTDLGAVYWVESCQSIVNSFIGVEILEGPPGVVIALREQPVRARRQNCPNEVPGAIVTITAKEVTEKTSATIRYRVKYDTEDGKKQSNHTVKIDLYP
ncbi:MAG: hypothetical protein RL682_1119 [Pseudomonadota bacterium]|jgi:hypothetical protein